MFVKDPSAILDYSVDWSQWMTTGDSIASVTWSPITGIVVESSPAPSFTSTVATAWIGSGTAGNTYTVTCHITTTAGRQDTRTLTFNVVSL
jgi:hypothetical protein